MMIKMPAMLTTAAENANELALRLQADGLVIIALCAAWCATCREFRPLFEQLASESPAHTYIWLDVEDDAAVAGDVDVQNFPSLAIFRARAGSFKPLHYGVSLPHQNVVRRLIEALANSERVVEVDDEVAALPDMLVRSKTSQRIHQIKVAEATAPSMLAG